MASLTIGAKGKEKGPYKNVVMDIGRKIKIGIGYVDGTKKEQSIFSTLEALESCVIRGSEPSRELWKRIDSLPSGVLKKLKKHDLISRKHDCPTLQEVKEEFIADKLLTGDPRTVRNYKTTLENGILTFLPKDRRFNAVDADDLMEFIRKSSSEYADSTVANHIKRAKALFQFAMDEGYIDHNPFTVRKVRERCALYSIKLSSTRSETQAEYMTPDEIARLLSCKKSLRSEIEDKEWNVLIHCLRYGAGRVSSYLVLRWQDINFEAGNIRLRMKRTGKRTKFTRGDKRIETVPLFWEMVEPLLELKEMQPEGTEYVLNKIGNLGSKPEFERTNKIGERIQQGRWETNLSTTFKKILTRNGFRVWSQPFHAFRSYRGAELDQMGAGELALSAWIGNSAEVRKTHYNKFHMLDAERFTKRETESA